MSENESGAERTEQPTAKRLTDAREKGNIPRSRELGTAAVFTAGVAALMAAGGPMATRALDWMRSALSPEPGLRHVPAEMFGHTGELLLRLLLLITPLMGACILAGLAGPALMGSLQFTANALAPDFKRLNPLAGLKRVYGPEGLVELVKSLLRVGLVGSVAAGFITLGFDRLLGLIHQPLEQAAGEGLGFALKLLLATAGALAGVAAIDAPYQKWNWMRKLKMTRQELRDEMKETDGRPEVKGRIRQMQMQLSQRQMMAAVPTADVVLVNPTHYAVALKYEGSTMHAPRVVAKGVDEMALRIREAAEQHRVTIVSAPPLARALYRESKIDQEIPVRLYAAVAQVLSYVYQLRNWRLAGGQYPEMPRVDVDEHADGNGGLR